MEVLHEYNSTLCFPGSCLSASKVLTSADANHSCIESIERSNF